MQGVKGSALKLGVVRAKGFSNFRLKTQRLCQYNCVTDRVDCFGCMCVCVCPPDSKIKYSMFYVYLCSCIIVFVILLVSFMQL